MLQHTTKKLRPAAKGHGGKWYTCRRITALFPPHRVYIEPFAGGLSCLLNKQPRASWEVASDLDTGLMAFYDVLVKQTSRFLARLPVPDPTREAFQACFDAALDKPTGDVDRAVKFLVRRRLSRGGLGDDLAWADRLRGKTHPDGPLPDLAASWRSMLEMLPAIAERLRGVELRSEPAENVIREFDGADTLFYLDPPYQPSARSAPDVYRHELTEAEHAGLLALVRSVRGRVVLSGYRTPLYDRMLADWRRVDIEVPNHSGQGREKQRRVESVWIKPD